MSAHSYQEFIEQKRIVTPEVGLSIEPSALNPALFEFQRDIVAWGLRKGRAAIFADCGLGKTPMQLEWARQIPGRVLILAPLAVGRQTAREGVKFQVGVTYTREPIESLAVTNYEMLEHFAAEEYAGIVLDESSILKSYDGAFRQRITEQFAKTPYRLACTATPAPNDFMELGNHAEFLGVLTRTEMRVGHDNSDLPVSLWQQLASPVWTDIDPSDTLQRESAREQADERHICPLQLEVIRRALLLWSKPGDTVLSPFAGIGSEGYEAVRGNRRFVGVELKESYFVQAVANLKAVEIETAPLFNTVPADSEAFPVALSTRVHAEEDDPASQKENEDFSGL